MGETILTLNWLSSTHWKFKSKVSWKHNTQYIEDSLTSPTASHMVMGQTMSLKMITETKL